MSHRELANRSQELINRISAKMQRLLPQNPLPVSINPKYHIPVTSTPSSFDPKSPFSPNKKTRARFQNEQDQPSPAKSHKSLNRKSLDVSKGTDDLLDQIEDLKKRLKSLDRSKSSTNKSKSKPKTVKPAVDKTPKAVVTDVSGNKKSCLKKRTRLDGLAKK